MVKSCIRRALVAQRRLKEPPQRFPPKIKDLKGGFTLPLSLPLETPQKSMFENGALAATKLWFLIKTSILRHPQDWPEFGRIGRSLAGLAGITVQAQKNIEKCMVFAENQGSKAPKHHGARRDV